jgi:YjbE family integral membrane protein
MEFFSPAWWAALGSIMIANILLSGDNAVVIAMAARGLPEALQKKAIFIGSAAAIVMRIVLTLVAAQLLGLPWLKLLGALALLYIGVTLLLPEGHDEEGGGNSHTSMATAIRTILIADLVMSLDNVIAVAAAAKGDIPLLIIGLATSIPLVIFGSTLLLKVIEKFPLIIWMGAALLGFIAGEILVADTAIAGLMQSLSAAIGVSMAQLPVVVGIAGAIFVVALAKILIFRHDSKNKAAA